MDRFLIGLIRGLTIITITAALVGFILGFRIFQIEAADGFQPLEAPAPAIDLTARRAQ